VHSARTHLVSLEQMSDTELDELQEEFQKLRDRLNTGATVQKPPKQ
jgi:hypothetical protein